MNEAVTERVYGVNPEVYDAVQPVITNAHEDPFTSSHVFTCPQCGQQFVGRPGAFHQCPSTRRKSDELLNAGVSTFTVQDAGIVREIVRALDEARFKHPPFRSLASGVVEVQRRAKMLGDRLCEASGQMTPEVRRKLVQTAAMCLRALTENA